MRSSTRIHVLIVEDTQSLLRLYSHILTQAGYIIDEATSIQAARAAILASPPDILLLDRVLPDGDGSEICTWIKGAAELEQIYVIMLSALKITEDDRIGSIEAGADDYLVKPIARRELLARLKVAARLKTTQHALRASEAKHRTLAENSPDLIMRLDREGLPVYVNARIHDIFRLSPEAFLSLTFEDMRFERSFMDRWYAACAAVVASGRQQEIDITANYTGSPKYFEARLVPEFDMDGRVSSILAVIRDFTERIRTEQAIARLATVVQQATDAVVITDPNGVVQYVNAAFLQIVGYGETPEGKNVRDLLGTVSLEETFHQVRESKTRWKGVCILRHKAGRAVETEASLYPIINRDGAVANIVATFSDLTERRRGEREREVLLAVASVLRKATTRQEIIHTILSQVITLLGLDSAALITFRPNEGKAVIEHVIGRHAHLSGITLDDEKHLSGPMLDGGQIYLNNNVKDSFSSELLIYVDDVAAVLGVPMLVGGKGIGALWVCSTESISDDVTGILVAIADMAANTLHRVSILEELEQYAANLEVRVQARTYELADANQRLLDLDRLKSKFVSNVSHELRTPISNLKLYLSLLRRGKPDKRTHYESMLELSAERLGQLVEDILNLSRLEIAHYKPRELAPTDLNAVINQIVALHQPEAEAAGVSLDFTPTQDLPLIQGDFNQLSQLVTNLVANALHYTPQGSVLVRTELLNGECDCQVCLSVEDTGVGILEEDVPHIFERFYRGNHRQSNDIPGTGLGLAIVKEIVDIHHGTITLDSSPNVGTRIRVTLPLAYTHGTD